MGYRCYAREHTANSGSNNDGVALTIFLKPGCLAFVSNQNAKGRLIANDLVALISRHRKRYEVTQGDGPSTMDLTHDAEYGAPRLLV